MDIRGKVHNPENVNLAEELYHLSQGSLSLRLPSASELQISVRSNRNGQRLLHGSLTEEIITTILASKCDWYSLLTEVSQDLKLSSRPAHTFVVFGLNDCVPMTPFYKQGLKITKREAHSLIPRIRIATQPDGDSLTLSSFPKNTIAVVGASCRLPGASNLEELWTVLANGLDRHEEVGQDRFDLRGSFRASQSGSFVTERKFYGNFLDDIKRFDNSFFGINAREASNMDPQQRLLLELSFEALEASGYLATHSRDAGDNVGCFIGASLVEYLDNTNCHPPTAYTSTGTIRAFLCGRLSHFYGWSGPAEVVDTACSSSLVAINRACKAIQSGECSMALAGGVNIIAGMNNYFDLGKAGFLSSTGQCKPFDQLADGYCRSDGAGLVVLKSLKQAILDHNLILGLIRGISTNQGGLSSSITVPHSAAQKALYQTVLQQSGLQSEQISYVEAHGTGL
jgi:3-oxoacyl-(acyl-carrier-protein) synthase